MRLLLKKAAAVGFLVFLVLWIVASVRGLTLPYPPPAPVGISGGDWDIGLSRSSNQQYAWNNLKQLGFMDTPLPLVLDKPEVEKIRIHEKKAVLSLGTPAFTEDEGRIHAAIKEHQAKIFTSKETGIEPHRRITLEIGVAPEQFDGLVEKLRQVGKLAGLTIEQKDRTSEFRKLFAKRQTEKKNLEAIGKLREGRTLTLDEALRLEQKTQEVEKELQSLSAQFGDLLGDESYYHVHVSLVEYQPGDKNDKTYTVPMRIFHAFWWAVVWWLAVAVAAGLIVASGISVAVLRGKSDLSFTGVDPKKGSDVPPA